MLPLRAVLLFGLASVPFVTVGTGLLFCIFLRDDPSFGSYMQMLGIVTGVSLLPFLLIAAVPGIKALRFRLRKPDIVITVTEPLMPLEAKFQEQDLRIEKRERLIGELFKLNGEIETFNANMSPDERKAWRNRPGPYGK